MSKDADGHTWCDRCWDNPATIRVVTLRGSQFDLCEECEEPTDTRTGKVRDVPPRTTA